MADRPIPERPSMRGLGAVHQAPRRSREAVDLSQIPQLTDAEILILEDESKVGTREWKRADQVRSRIVELIRWEKRRMG